MCRKKKRENGNYDRDVGVDQRLDVGIFNCSWIEATIVII